jgi:hypothetical protein
MINRTLHSLTNRAGGFNTPALPTNPSFHPATETLASRQLRALLGLSRTQDDYHLFAVLAAVEAFPSITDAFEDPVKSYTLEDYQTPAPAVIGATVIDDAKGAWSCAVSCNEVPVPDRFSFAYRDTGFGQLSYGKRREVLPVGLVSGNKVYPQWPADFGFNGGFGLTWTSGATATVVTWPSRFPYETLAEQLRTADCKNEFLRQQSLLDHFHLAPTALEKVAVTALALGRANTAVYG